MADSPISGLPVITVVSSSYLLAAVSASVTSQMTVKQVGDAYSSSFSTFPYSGSARITGSLDLIGDMTITGSVTIPSNKSLQAGVVTASALASDQGLIMNGSISGAGVLRFKQYPTVVSGWNDTTAITAVHDDRVILAFYQTGSTNYKTVNLFNTLVPDGSSLSFNFPSASGTLALKSDITGSPAFPYSGSAQITGSLGVTGSLNISGSLLNGLNASAPGDYSHAEGFYATASGNFSHAEGFASRTYGNYSHAEGEVSTALGDSSHAEGSNTLASGSATHTEGYSTIAKGFASHAEGNTTLASGPYSHAEGQYTTASANYSHAEGSLTVATASGAHAEGSGSVAKGVFSHAEGATTIASGSYSHAEGIGNLAQGAGSHVEGTSTYAIGAYSHAEGGATVVNGEGAHAEGLAANAYGAYAHAEGYTTYANAPYSHAEGNQSVAYGQYSHVEGNQTTTEGQYAHAEGSLTAAIGIASHAEGTGTIASGSGQHVEGKYNLQGNTTSLMVIGDGASTSSRHDLLRAEVGQIQITGSLNVTGSVNVIGGITGSISATNGVISGSSQLITSFPLKTTGTWTVPTGSSTQSFTVEANSSYTMWVNGNIPNGIITWNATATLSNTNVPVVGAQYGWYYVTGNALVLTSIPNQFTGISGSISTTPSDYAPNTSNVFNFGITNNSGTAQTINYGYIKLS